MDLSRVGHRDQLKARREPYWQRLRIGCFVGYRASKRGKAGTWISRVLDPETSKYRIKSLGDLGKMAKNEMFAQAKQETERFSDEIDCGGSPETVLETVEDACRQYAINSLDAEGRFKRYVYGKPIARIKLTKLRRHHLREWRQWLSNEPLKLNDETGIYTLSSETISEELSLAITNNLYDEIKLFFEEEVFQNQKQLADILAIKSDSIRSLNESKVRQIAKFEDSNRGMVSNEIMATKKILSQESMALTTAYAELMKNKEMTDVNLKDMQPLFMAIDTPFNPIDPSRSSLLLSLLKGLMIGAFLAVVFILFKKIYTDAMSN